MPHLERRSISKDGSLCPGSFHVARSSAMEQKTSVMWSHGDVMKWKHFPRYWPFVQGIHPSRVNSLHKDQWRGALMFSLICAWINGWVNNCEAGDLRRHCAHYNVTVMSAYNSIHCLCLTINYFLQSSFQNQGIPSLSCLAENYQNKKTYKAIPGKTTRGRTQARRCLKKNTVPVPSQYGDGRNCK